jgi:hypothetical protein
MTKINGGGSCGEVRFCEDADPAFVAVCHCRTCQKASGSAFAVIVALPAAAPTFAGDVTTYDSKGNSGLGKHYRFCPSCGSPIASNVGVIPDLMMIRSRSLDDPSWVKPAMESYCEAKHPWVALGDDLKSYARMPG